VPLVLHFPPLIYLVRNTQSFPELMFLLPVSSLAPSRRPFQELQLYSWDIIAPLPASAYLLFFRCLIAESPLVSLPPGGQRNLAVIMLFLKTSLRVCCSATSHLLFPLTDLRFCSYPISILLFQPEYPPNLLLAPLCLRNMSSFSPPKRNFRPPTEFF